MPGPPAPRRTVYSALPTLGRAGACTITVPVPCGPMWQMANKDRKAHPKIGTEREEPVGVGGPALDQVEDDSTQTLTKDNKHHKHIQ